ncbi:MAG: hypothetical protein ACI4CS_04490 [Candidatus Weimeria sp.]
MNKKIKYNDVMENLTMTPEMENRILENLKKAEASSEKDRPSKTFRFRRRWIASLAAAAAAFVVIIGSVTADNLISRVTPDPASQTVTSDSKADDSSDSTAQSDSADGFLSSGNDADSGSSDTTSPVSSTGSDSSDTTSPVSGTGSGSKEKSSATGRSSSTTGSSSASNSSKTNNSVSSGSGSGSSASNGSKTGSSASNSSKSGSSASNGSKTGSSASNGSKTGSSSDKSSSKDDKNPDTVVSGSNDGSAAGTDYGSLAGLEKAAGFRIIEPALPFDAGQTEYLMDDDGTAEIYYTSEDQKYELNFAQSENKKAIESRFSDEFKSYDTVEELSVNSAEISIYGSDDGYMMAMVTNGSLTSVISVTTPLSFEEMEKCVMPLCQLLSQ